MTIIFNTLQFMGSHSKLDCPLPICGSLMNRAASNRDFQVTHGKGNLGIYLATEIHIALLTVAALVEIVVRTIYCLLLLPFYFCNACGSTFDQFLYTYAFSIGSFFSGLAALTTNLFFKTIISCDWY